MSERASPGIGELLRHLVELTDGQADGWYEQQGLDYRPRYTPIMRALASGPATVSDIQENLSVTQGAVSQTLKLMLQDGLIARTKGQDARQSVINLTEHGKAVLNQLKPHWEATFTAIENLEDEIQAPLRGCLIRTIAALSRRSFSDRIQDSKSRDAKYIEAESPEKEPFQAGGDRYSQFRPSYSTELAKSLAQLAPETNLAIDVGCGNGQLTKLLSPHFDEVIGIDPSKSQLEHAMTAKNVIYREGIAEDLGIADESVDLITVAQSAHWFDLEKFYAEAQRVAKCDAAIVLVSYGVPIVADSVNTAFQRGYWQEIHEFWPAERVHVETGYADLMFPFPSIEVSSHSFRAHMRLDEFINYITTWSAYTNACAQGQESKFELFFESLRKDWSGELAKEIVWPLSVKAGRIQKSGVVKK